MKIIKGDKVEIIIGKDKGRSGEVFKTLPKSGKVFVKGLNIVKKHIKPSQGQKGRLVEKEAPLAVSKVILICPNCQKKTRVAYKISENGTKSRICKKCQALITLSKK
ncbi:50S ribosomal protein L24 [Candidatus Shapirobacteria bacterium]|jgi:large subunit ribosomal protein L24|nr:50S ribosomal protein L24 [Candidatus Shapirobacteria bacterium]HQI13296.1 50S ribosomal protein L24 [Candidatus Woesebacteria bacterium]